VTNLYSLPLESPRWSQLGTFGVPPEEIPLLLKQLLNDPTNNLGSPLRRLANGIFHQYELADAAYFVFPYLADVQARFPQPNPWLAGLVANIAATADIDRVQLPPAAHQVFLDTLLHFERLAVSDLLVTDQPFAAVYGVCMDALAFARHCCGKLLLDVLERDGAHHTGLTCLGCGCSMEVALFQDGVAIMQTGLEPEPPNPPQPFATPSLPTHSKRKINPWQPVGEFLSREVRLGDLGQTERLHVDLAMRLCSLGIGPAVLPEEAFSLIGAILLAHGFSDSARRLFRLWDTVTCPACLTPFVAARGWWGCVQGLRPT
jgi:hypothetical protein